MSIKAETFIEILKSFSINYISGVPDSTFGNLFNILDDDKEIKELSNKIKDDLTIDLLAQFSEALRKKYKITINDDVIDQLN